MAPRSSPTIVLVHGAFADASSWAAVHRALSAEGFRVIAPPVPLRGVAADAESLRRVIDGVDGDVVLVGHAYGGAVITVAGDHPKVKALVYVAGYALDEGESLSQLEGRFPDSALAGTDVSIAPHAFEEPARVAAWKIKPSYGLVPAADTTINPDVHRFAYERAAMTIVEVPGASHAVQLSDAGAVTALVREAVDAL